MTRSRDSQSDKRESGKLGPKSEQDDRYVHVIITINSHSFCSLSYDRSVASSKASSPQSAI
jgi:hypothetical protein